MKIRPVFMFLFLMLLAASIATAADSPTKVAASPFKAPQGKFIHIVYIWLKPDLDRKDIRAFEKDMRDLKKIKTVKSMEIGKPAGTKRDVVDNTYSYAIIMYFNDATAHDLYQIDPIHKDFVDKHKAKWVRIQVYDTLVE